MNTLYQIQDMIEDELSKISRKSEMSASDLECAYKMVDILKDISTIEAMRTSGYSQDDYSERYYMPGSSYRRGRDSMGRYTSRDGYSGHDKASMIEGLRTMMNNATSETERMHIHNAIDELSR